VSWFDVRTGKLTTIKRVSGKGVNTFAPPKDGKDWVLVIDDASKKFSESGVVK
jgi:hypothetical protein